MRLMAIGGRMPGEMPCLPEADPLHTHPPTPTRLHLIADPPRGLVTTNITEHPEEWSNLRRSACIVEMCGNGLCECTTPCSIYGIGVHHNPPTGCSNSQQLLWGARRVTLRHRRGMVCWWSSIGTPFGWNKPYRGTVYGGVHERGGVRFHISQKNTG